MSANQKPKRSTFEHSQHLLRGAVARLNSLRQRPLLSRERSRKPIIEIDEISEARRNLQSVLMRARSILSKSEYFDYLSYFYKTIASLSLEKSENQFDQLLGSIAFQEVGLDNEIEWVRLRIAFEKETISRHLETLYLVDSALLQGALGTALSLLDRHAAQEGHSIWSVQLKLALEQNVNGLEAQKGFFEQIRRRHKSGILAYVAYQASVRNEDRTTFGRYRDGLEPRLDAIKPTALARYLRYALLGDWPEDARGVADVLRIGQSQSIVDVYEMMVALCQEIARNANLSGFQPHAAAFVSDLPVDDARIAKLRLRLTGILAPSLGLRETAVGDALLTGNLSKAALHSRRAVRSGDVWGFIYRSAALAHKPTSGSRPQRTVPELLRQVLARSSDGSVAVSELQKACFNTAGSPSMRAIYDLADQLRTGMDDEPFRFSLASLNAKLVGPEDLSDEAAGISSALSPLLSKSPSLTFWSGTADGADQLQEDIARFGRAVALERAGSYAEAVAAISPKLQSMSSAPVRSLGAGLLLRCLTELGDGRGIIQLVASEAARPSPTLDLLPVAASLRNVPFETYKAMGSSLEPLVALDVLQRVDDSDRVRSQLRFATKRFLQSTGGKPPSSLADARSKYDHNLLVYFLRHICVPSIIDMAGIFSSSHDVLVEREAICAALNTLDPRNSAEYRDEIIGIIHQRTISEGLKIVDKNRVHVDTDMVARGFERSYAEEYARYVDLRQAGIGVSGDFDEVVRELLSSSRLGKQILFTPENEADSTFVSLTAHVLDDFLHNSSYGFDYFLSKRIRHQSFIGLLRGPLEFEQLITTRETATSDYRPNDYWLARLQTLNESQQRTIDAAFRAFADGFDRAVFDLKDRLFHVRTPERPDGIFEIPMTSYSLLLARAVVKSVDSPAEFAKAVCEILWVQIEPKLKEARALIADNLTMKVAGLIDVLKLALNKDAASDPALADVQLAIGRASAAVQTALGEAEAWFNRPQVAQAARLFSLADAVDIAIRSAQKLHKAFEPQLTVNASGDLFLQAGDLVFLTDAVFIAFSNIRSHSGLAKPTVNIDCTMDTEAEELRLDVTNAVNPRARTPEQDRRIEEIRALIAKSSFGKQAKREGGTGFLKLAAVVGQSKKGRLDFGYTDDQQFRLTIVWSIILAESVHNE